MGKCHCVTCNKPLPDQAVQHPDARCERCQDLVDTGWMPIPYWVNIIDVHQPEFPELH